MFFRRIQEDDYKVLGGFLKLNVVKSLKLIRKQPKNQKFRLNKFIGIISFDEGPLSFESEAF